MKVVILAGGLGTRISEESYLKPKPMIEIGGKPILWHIMKIYSYYGFNDFIICLGYKGYTIKEYFAHYFLHESDVTFDFRNQNSQYIHKHNAEPWQVTLVNTGNETMTGGRIKRIKQFVNDQTFMLTYGDGVANVDIKKSLDFHKKHGKKATMTTTQPLGRFGALDFVSDTEVSGFKEKPKGDGGWVNAGFFVLEPTIFDFIASDSISWEREPLEALAKQRELFAYKHNGFWQPMDTLRDKNHLEELWNSGNAPWQLWS